MTREGREHSGGLGFRLGPDTTDEAKDAKVEVEWGDNLEVILKVTCPLCGHENRVEARNAAPGHELRCQCGHFNIILDGDDLRDVQAAADEVRRTFESLSK